LLEKRKEKSFIGLDNKKREKKSMIDHTSHENEVVRALESQELG
jgi:hypothetical protein